MTTAPDQTDEGPESKRGRRAFAVCLGLAVALLGAEGLARWTIGREDLTPPPPAEIDPYGENQYIRQEAKHLYFHLPNARYRQVHPDYQVDYRINARGFRGPEIAPRPPAGTRRLVVVGDSMVEGHGVEEQETFAALLNDTLPGWEVVNAGVQGASPIYYAANLERYFALGPDAILLVTFANDLAEDRIRELSYGRPDLLVTAPAALGYGDPPAWGLGSLFRWYRDGPLSYRIRTHHEALGQPNSRAEGAALAGYLVPTSRFDDYWEITHDYLTLTEYLLDRQGGVPVLAAHLSLDFDWAGRETAHRVQSQRLAQAVQVWADGEDVPLLRLDQTFAADFASQARPPIVFPNDPHLTALGHVRVAEELRPWLAEQLP